jgi:hypothetical protein
LAAVVVDDLSDREYPTFTRHDKVFPAAEPEAVSLTESALPANRRKQQFLAI